MPRPGPRRPLVALRLGDQEIAEVDRLAADEGVTRSALIRRWIHEAIHAHTIREVPMTTTTSYGNWGTQYDPMAPSIRETVLNFLGECDGDYDVDGLVDAWRDAINEALPPDVSLNGDEFYGPHYERDQHFDDYPATEDGDLDIAAIIDSVDLEALAEQYDRTTAAHDA